MPTSRPDLTRYALLSIVVAAVTIVLKLFAWRISGSVGLLSDAAETVVNLVAAVAAFIALKVAARPADKSHNFGHAKAEYFSAVFEGVMIVVAAILIIVAAIERLLNPQELDQVGLGLAVAIAATVLNGVTGMLLLRAGRRHRSMTLQADGKHLLTDVWTTIGVVVGVILVAVTGWLPLDSIVALCVAVNIIVVGGRVMARSAAGLMDAAMPADDRAVVDRVLGEFAARGIDFHDVRTREAAHERFVQFHMLVPGQWSVQDSHDLTEEVESALHAELDHLRVIVHVEPVEDERSYESWRLS